VDIVLIGAQGSGKGTQSEKLSQSLGICHVASGDLFRFNETIRLLDYYRKEHKLIEVDGNQDIGQVQANLVQAVKDNEKKKS